MNLKTLMRIFCFLLVMFLSEATIARSTPVLDAGYNHGVFSGGANVTNAANFEAWLGRPSNYNVEFASQKGYTVYDSITDSIGYSLDKWANAGRPDRNMLYSIPLATEQDPSLANVANGKYDAYFQKAAVMIAKYYPNAIIRLGWEFNLSSRPWSAVGRAQDYINAFRRVSRIFTTVSPGFTIDWCPGMGLMNMPAEQAYPGDDVVDVIGMDAYDDWRYYTEANSAIRWANFRDRDHGLAWHKKFAAAHGKPLSFPEWGTNHDDPDFIQHMFNWITVNNFAYASYWNANNDFASMLSNNQYPNAAAKYQALFSSYPVILPSLSQWNKVSATVTGMTGTASDGAIFSLTGDGSYNYHGLDTTLAPAHIINDRNYTLSFLVKANGLSRVRFGFFDKAGVKHQGIFDLVGGTVVDTQGITAYSIVNKGNGWFQCFISASMGHGSAAPWSFVRLTDAQNAPQFSTNSGILVAAPRLY